MYHTNQVVVAHSLDEAARIIQSAYTLMISETNIKMLRVNDGVFNNSDYQKSVESLNQIGIMSRRLKFELREDYNLNNDTNSDPTYLNTAINNPNLQA